MGARRNAGKRVARGQVRGLAVGGAGGAVAWYRAGGAPLPVAAYQPKGAASLAASYVNLANPGTYDAAPGVAPTWAAETGWTFNGSTQYLTTGVVPVNDQTWSAFVRFSGVPTGVTAGMCLLGSLENSGWFYLSPRDTSGATKFWGNGEILPDAGALVSGVMAFAGTGAYLDGASAGTIAAAGGSWSWDLLIGARRTATTPSQFLSGNIQAAVIYNATLTADQVAAVSAAMAAL